MAKLGHAGDEEQDHLRIGLPDPAGGLHAVDARHHNVQHHDVILSPEIVQELNAADIQGVLQLISEFLGELLQMLLHDLRAVFFVFYNGNPHGFSLRL